MLTNRKDDDHHTEIAVWNEGDIPAYQSYRITCMDLDYDTKADKRMPPTARIWLLSTTGADVEQTRRLAREYDYVADLAEQLQAEKRAAYAARFGVEQVRES